MGHAHIGSSTWGLPQLVSYQVPFLSGVQVAARKIQPMPALHHLWQPIVQSGPRAISQFPVFTN